MHVEPLSRDAPFASYNATYGNGKNYYLSLSDYLLYVFFKLSFIKRY